MLIAVVLVEQSRCVEIIGGKEAWPHSRPYMALIQTKNNLCGGTLIKTDWVLTAAHCQIDKSTTIDLGVHSRTKIDTLRQQFKILRAIPHQRFDKNKLVNDIQLLQLSGNASLNKAVNIMPLAKTFNDIKAGTICDTAGWGIYGKQSPRTSDKLMEVRLTVFDRKRCNSVYQPTLKITRNMMCTSDKEAKGICNGDAGGPLICNRVFSGISSFGPILCGIPNGTNVYTRLTKDYIKWIKKETK
ncbi:granzyme A-like [Pelodytes ibericus]